MFEIIVRRAMKFQEVIIKTGWATIESGLLDKKEALIAASEFIASAEALLPAEMAKQELKLSEVREHIEGR